LKHVLFIVRTAPYGSAAVPESVRSCLGFGTMPMLVSYLLMDDGVWAVAPSQEPSAIGGANALELIQGLSDLDVTLYAEIEALQARGLAVDGLEPGFAPVSRDEISELIAQSDIVMTY